jgi:protein-disulfide isomerase
LTARQAVRESAPGYLFAGSTLALAVVLYLGYASLVILQTTCPVCLVTYAAVIGLFFVTGAATSFPMTSLPRRAVSDLVVLVSSPMAIGLALLFAGASASTLAFFPREGAAPAPIPVTQDQRTELQRLLEEAPRVPLVIPSQGAKVLIVKFNDYQCPACAKSYFDYKSILAKYAASHPGAVRVVMKDFPLNRNCNQAAQTNLHPAACEAAVAVRLARAQNRGDAMEEWLYTHHKEMTAQSVRQAAREIGGVTDFDAKYASTIEQVKLDVAMGQQLRVGSTPTFFINGVKIDAAWAPQYFDQVIQYELQRAK